MTPDIQQFEDINYLFREMMREVFLAPDAEDEQFRELTDAQKKILYILKIHGPQKMSEIAQQVSVSMAAATGVVDKLVSADSVTREHAQYDRRVVMVALSDAGTTCVAMLDKIHERRLKKILEMLPQAKRGELIQAFERIHHLLKEIRAARDGNSNKR